jgi:hypothetical protein
MLLDHTVSMTMTMMLSMRTIAIILLLLPCASAWITAGPVQQQQRRVTSSRSTTRLLALLPENYQAIGEKLIRDAGVQCGATDLEIEWKDGKLKVVVLSDAFLSNTNDGVGEDEVEEDEVEEDEEESDDEEEESDEISLEQQPVVSTTTTGVDVGALARTINAALDDGGVGLQIAENHEIEVTTPGAPDELSGIMWDVYQGFDVICEHRDPKTDKVKKIDGRLQERNSEFTVINIKGRMKKLKNVDIISVKLPKAKKEKR